MLMKKPFGVTLHIKNICNLEHVTRTNYLVNEVVI